MTNITGLPAVAVPARMAMRVEAIIFMVTAVYDCVQQINELILFLQRFEIMRASRRTHTQRVWNR